MSIVRWQPFSMDQCMRTSASSSSRVRVPAVDPAQIEIRLATAADAPALGLFERLGFRRTVVELAREGPRVARS
jgi:hypothetical protein